MGWAGVNLSFSTVTIFSISLGIAVDNTIHYLARFRLEIEKDGDHVGAMRRTLHGAGRPMLFTTVMLLMGCATILTSNFMFTFYFALLGGFTITVALLADLFVTPSLFLLLRPRIARGGGRRV
jgi:predicted RND superfamily exporter protein